MNVRIRNNVFSVHNVSACIPPTRGGGREALAGAVSYASDSMTMARIRSITFTRYNLDKQTLYVIT